METKSLCAKIPLDLHNQITTQKDQSGLTLNDYMTHIITQYYQMKEGQTMTDKNTCTLAIQIPVELMNQLKAHLKTTGQSQKAFLTALIQQTLESAHQPAQDSSVEDDTPPHEEAS